MFLHPETKQEIVFDDLCLEELQDLSELVLEKLTTIDAKLSTMKMRAATLKEFNDHYPRVKTMHGHMGRLHQKLLHEIKARKGKSDLLLLRQAIELNVSREMVFRIEDTFRSLVQNQ